MVSQLHSPSCSCGDGGAELRRNRWRDPQIATKCRKPWATALLRGAAHAAVHLHLELMLPWNPRSARQQWHRVKGPGYGQKAHGVACDAAKPCNSAGATSAPGTVCSCGRPWGRAGRCARRAHAHGLSSSVAGQVACSCGPATGGCLASGVARELYRKVQRADGGRSGPVLA